MNPYKFKTTCKICGGPGMATLNAVYFGQHTNPNVCRFYLDLKRRELENKNKTIEEKEIES